MKINKVIAGVMAVCVMGFGVPYVNTAAENNSVITASAEDETEYIWGTYEQLAYVNYGDYIEIYGCDQSATEIVIPAEIEGVPVTSIGELAFYECNSLTSVEIPDSITSIGRLAFEETLWLKEKQKENPLVIVNNILIDGTTCKGDVVIPDGVTSIVSQAFSGCEGLTSIEIPDSVTNIEFQTFYGCENLTSVTISDGVTSIEAEAFTFCSSLASIKIPDSVTSIGDYAFSRTLWLEEKQKENPLVIVNDILIDGEKCSGKVVIPDSVTSIAGSAFASCDSLKSIEIPNSVTSIGRDAFYFCTGLISVKISDSVTSIGKGAFSYCFDLKTITILNSDCDIADYDFTISNAYDNANGKFYFNGTIYGYENSTTQAYAEKYERNFVSLGKAPEKETGSGDMNGDNSVSVADAVLLQSYILGKQELTKEQLKNADLTSDGLVDSFDMVMLRHKLIENNK